MIKTYVKVWPHDEIGGHLWTFPYVKTRVWDSFVPELVAFSDF